MSFIKVYKYNTEQEAIEAISLIDNYFGIPLPNNITQHYTDYRKIDEFYCILYFEDLVNVLGNPVDIEINLLK